MRTEFELGGVKVKPAGRAIVELPVSVMTDHTPVNLSVHVRHGRDDGPTLFVSAAVHGDEIIGVEIVRRLLQSNKLTGLRGTLLAIPIVNRLGFINRSRYLPDRRDLNRSFPGSERGSLAARLANIFLGEVVAKADVGIDLHSAAIHRSNLPQIRIAPQSDRLAHLADAFAAPVVVTRPMRAGSLRQAAHDKGVDLLLYEAGEALRFDETAVRIGVAGVLRVMAALGMISAKGLGKGKTQPIRSRRTVWTRAPAGGLLRSYKTVGDTITTETDLGVIADPFGEVEIPIHSAHPGLIVGRTNLPLVNEGDALFHVARIGDAGEVENTIDALTAQLSNDDLFDEDEII